MKRKRIHLYLEMGVLKLDILKTEPSHLKVIGKNFDAQKPAVKNYRNTQKMEIDYYAGGMPMPGRSLNLGGYRYGHGTQEMVDEISGAGNHYTAPFWEYDPRLMRRWNTDPIVYPWQSPYATFNNNPIFYNDPLGLEGSGPGIGAKIKHFFKVQYSKITGKTTPVTTKYGRKTGGTGKGGNKEGGDLAGGNSKGDIAGDNIGKHENPISFPDIDLIAPRDPFITTPNSPNELINNIPPSPPVFANNPFIPPPGGNPIRFNQQIGFNPSSNQMSQPNQAQNQLQPLANSLINNPGATVLIIGNVFNPALIQGNTPAALNQQVFMNGNLTRASNLMNSRAQAVANQLIMMGVNPSQVLFGPGNVRNNASGLNLNFIITNPAPNPTGN